MALERVAHFARLAASDGGVLAALQDDPERMRQPLELSDAQVRALISASAFTSDKPVQTTSRSEDPVGDTTNLMELGTLGTLLPPEGSGAFPVPGDLPPAPLAPISMAPTYPAPTPHGTPKAATPTGPSPTPAQPSTPTFTPQAAPTSAPRWYAAPVPYSPLSATTGVGSGQASGSPQQRGTTSSGGQGPVVQRYATAQAPTMPAVNLPSITVPTASGSCGCSCEVGMIAIVAQLSATAQSAITAITAIAGMN